MIDISIGDKVGKCPQHDDDEWSDIGVNAARWLDLIRQSLHFNLIRHSQIISESYMDEWNPVNERLTAISSTLYGFVQRPRRLPIIRLPAVPE